MTNWKLPDLLSYARLWLNSRGTFPFFPGVLLSTKPKPWRSSDRLLKRTMVEKNGSPRSMSKLRSHPDKSEGPFGTKAASNAERVARGMLAQRPRKGVVLPDRLGFLQSSAEYVRKKCFGSFYMCKNTTGPPKRVFLFFSLYKAKQKGIPCTKDSLNPETTLKTGMCFIILR